ncbi:MAG: hypothetical protein K8S13_14605 [Desulfobacula sp.]|uniref:hypothetical protein n=1 Tax=Desulfobacula sp. TaxID=2593537 RepID=UPI0025C14319|nr:hypothetical protein [Desulfobacula sp.]MCD4721068.1 hypothetical protein [Desulfobacula sp.]
MKEEQTTHLNTDQIMVAMVDESDLDDAARQHLSACTFCRQRQSDLMKQYTGLGNMACRFTPDFKQNIRMPEYTRKVPVQWKWGFTQIIGLSVAVTLILIVVLNPLFQKFKTIVLNNTQIVDTESEMALMIDIENLVEDPLPPAYQGIVGMPDIDSDDDFMNFIVPQPEESDLVSFVTIHGKGAMLC